MYNILELSGLFVYLGDLSFSVPGGTEKSAGLSFTRRDQYLGDTMATLT